MMTKSYFMSSKKGRGKWTEQENKMFENALAHMDIRTPDMWARVADMLPGKTVRDVISHYRDLEDDVNHIEAGLIPFPGYSSSPFTLDWEGDFDGTKQFIGGKRSGGRLADHERKKGVPWTEEEHKLFLLGLKKYGKGDWRNISRNFVETRTPTQVASHAQKYFIRLNAGGKDKRRASIHDITTANLADNDPCSPSQTFVPATQSNSIVDSGLSDLSTVADLDQHSEAASGFSPLMKNGSRFMQLPYGVDQYGMELAAQNSHRGSLHDPMVAHCQMLM